MSELRVIPVEGLPEVSEGTKLGQLIARRTELQDGDVVVISQKVVSKAEGMVRKLSDVEPSERAIELGKRLGKEAELVELILSESRELLREERVLITETKHGFVCANAGIDTSNLPEEGTVCLLPTDPDATARSIRKELETAAGAPGAGVTSSRHSTSSHRRDVSGGGHPPPDPRPTQDRRRGLQPCRGRQV
jgi:coenzyme F420-0:L-glutamate ligase/coenzyme F420-1:gamma-L-glutamate ligase